MDEKSSIGNKDGFITMIDSNGNMITKDVNDRTVADNDYKWAYDFDCLNRMEKVK